MGIISLSENPDFLGSGSEFKLALDNYKRILTVSSLHFLDYLRNSIIISGISAFFTVLIAGLAAYAITRLSFVGKVFILLFVLAPLAAALIRMAISRNNEFSADRTGASLSNPLHLASALEKIADAAKQHPVKGNESTAHMFIINPFSGSFTRLFSTHPPVEDRVARLRRMAV